MIERSADRLLVFRGEIHRRDLGQPQDFQGEFALDFTFRANLVRGHYSVLVYLQHTSRQAFLVPPMQVATFSIHELASREGLVHVDLTARLRESLVPSVDS